MDLGERFRGADRIAAPDLWDEIAWRESSPAKPPKAPRRRGRISSALVAAAVFLAAFLFLRTSFRNTQGFAGSHPNGVIAYVGAVPDGTAGVNNTDIILEDPVTGATADLSNTRSTVEIDPVFSPDGSRLAVVERSLVEKGGTFIPSEGLFVMNADGSDRKQIVSCPDGCDLWDLVWSPDDQHLAWVQARTGLHVADIITGVTSRLCPSVCGPGIGQLAWSPDELKLLFASQPQQERVPTPFTSRPPGLVWVVNADGSELRALTSVRDVLSAGTPARVCGQIACMADTSPVWSPDGRQIAFSRTVHTAAEGTDSVSFPTPGHEYMGSGFATELIVMDAAGSSQRVLMTCSGRACLDLQPQWSPDGRTVAVNGPQGSNRIRLVDVSTGSVTTVTTGGLSDCDGGYDPTWSPDGRELLFAARFGRVYCSIGIDGSGERVLLRSPSPGEPVTWLPAAAIPSVEPKPLPSSPYLRTSLPAGRIATDGPNDIEVMSSDGTISHAAVVQTLRYYPSWSPDGTRLAFVAQAGIGTMAPDGSSVRLVVRVPCCPAGLSWSPSGQEIAYAVTREGVWVVHPDGTGLRRVVEGSFSDPSFSPDGTRIVASESGPDGRHLAVIDLATGSVSPLVDLPGEQLGASWSPDGIRIAFIWTTHTGVGLYSVSWSGGDLRRLSELPAVPGTTAWTSDGRFVLFVEERAGGGTSIDAAAADGSGTVLVASGFGGGATNLAWGPPPRT